MFVSEVTAKRSPAPLGQSASIPLPNHFRYLHRAFVEPRRSPGIELTVFVQASSRRWAIHRMAIVIAALEDGSTVESVSERIYNCVSAAECLEEGLSEDPELRIFETGWSGGKPICFVRHPPGRQSQRVPTTITPRQEVQSWVPHNALEILLASANFVLLNASRHPRQRRRQLALAEVPSLQGHSERSEANYWLPSRQRTSPLRP
jgi:hypothetical protein